MSSETYDWDELRGVACERFSDAPGPELEQRILAVFTEHPALVSAAIESVARGFEAGRVHSPWPMLATQVEREAERAASGIVASGAPDRARAVQLAERYLATAGMFLPSEAELVDELFGARGRLKPWVADDALVARMVAAWRARQPAAAQTEAEQLERAESWRKARPPRHDLGTARTSDDDTTQTAQPSHSRVPLTRVSAPPALVGAGADADIAW